MPEASPGASRATPSVPEAPAAALEELRAGADGVQVEIGAGPTAFRSRSAQGGSRRSSGSAARG